MAQTTTLDQLQSTSKVWTNDLESEIDNNFMQRVINEVQQSCALPFSVPAERIPEFILQGAQYFWETCDQAVEERNFLIRKSDINKNDKLNRIVCLPPQIVSVFGCHKVQEHLKYSTMGDFSIERMMMSSFSMFSGSGAGALSGGVGNTSYGYTLSEMVTALWEIDQFDQMLNPPLTYNFNKYSGKLVLLGDIGYSDLLIQCWKRLRIQDLYNNYWYFRWVVCLCKRALSTIYGAFSYKLPGGVEINYSMFQDQADSEMDEIKEQIQSQISVGYFFQPNTI